MARAILKDEADAEDALQDAYLDAYRHIGDFRAEAQLGTVSLHADRRRSWLASFPASLFC